MKAQQVLLWAVMNQTGVDFCVNQNHFQISYLGKGFWERIFPKGSHPVRRNVSEEKIQEVLDNTTEFILFEKRNDFNIISRSDFEQMVTSSLKS